jgi:hypothetical protein
MILSMSSFVVACGKETGSSSSSDTSDSNPLESLLPDPGDLGFEKDEPFDTPITRFD